MKIKGSKILVTGGCGLVGSTTIDLLLRDYDPAQIVIIDNLNRGTLHNVDEALKDPRVSLVRGDIRDVETMHENGCRHPHGDATHHRVRCRTA
jgi:UDP-glucose 4-epimerase